MPDSRVVGEGYMMTRAQRLYHAVAKVIDEVREAGEVDTHYQELADAFDACTEFARDAGWIERDVEKFVQAQRRRSRSKTDYGE